MRVETSSTNKQASITGYITQSVCFYTLIMITGMQLIGTVFLIHLCESLIVAVIIWTFFSLPQFCIAHSRRYYVQG